VLKVLPIFNFAIMEHLALDKNDNVYVTDPQPDPGCSMKPRVLKFDSNDVFITKFAVFGNKLDQSSDPEHLAVDNEGDVYVSDRENDSMQKFSLDKNG